MAGLVLPFSALTKAEVTLDGTLGPAGSLAGPNFVVPDTVGQTVGTNLFHVAVYPPSICRAPSAELAIGTKIEYIELPRLTSC